MPSIAQRDLGLITPFDFSLDRELWRWVPEDVSLHVTRLPIGARDPGRRQGRSHRGAQAGLAGPRHRRHPSPLLASPRADEIVRGLLAESRPAFHVMDNPRRFHEPSLERNRQILDFLETTTRPPIDCSASTWIEGGMAYFATR